MSKSIKPSKAEKSTTKKVVMLKCENPEAFRLKIQDALNDDSLELLCPPSQMRHEMCAFFIKEE
jgi:hypothetical protein